MYEHEASSEPLSSPENMLNVKQLIKLSRSI